MNTMQTDIIVVGAGIVGAALACALARQQIHCVLLDNQVAPRSPAATKDNLRVSALTFGSRQWLASLGAWQHLDEQQLGIFRTMQVWEQNAKIDFDSADLGIPTLGYIVPNQLLNNALLQELASSAYVQIIRPAKPQSLHFTKDQVQLSLMDQEVVAKLIVGADGAHSWVREQCKFILKSRPYAHTALVAHLHLEKPHQQCAYQRFKQDDILAFLPLADPLQCSLVWSGKPERIAELQALTTEQFSAALQQAWGDSLGRITTQQPRKTFPLTMRHANSYIQERVAIIGDAAHTLHPLAGQGLNLGLKDAEALTYTLSHVNQQQRDIGRHSNLRRFERQRRWDNDVMLAAVASNKWLFSHSNSSISLLRQMGMTLFQHTAWLKRSIMLAAQ